ncbi:MAG: hypothetical protein ACLQMH_08895 [Solirubrobacteraceae bacterium]
MAAAADHRRSRWWRNVFPLQFLLECYLPDKLLELFMRNPERVLTHAYG